MNERNHHHHHYISVKCDTLNNQDKEKQNMVNCALILNTSAQKLHILLPLTFCWGEKKQSKYIQ